MNDSLSKLEKRTAYTLVLPAVLLVFAIVLFPIFAKIGNKTIANTNNTAGKTNV